MRWRAEWAHAVNTALADAGRPERVDHRAGVQNHLGEPQLHLGGAATQMERRGIKTEGGSAPNSESAEYLMLLQRFGHRQHSFSVGRTCWYASSEKRARCRDDTNRTETAQREVRRHRGTAGTRAAPRDGLSAV